LLYGLIRLLAWLAPEPVPLALLLDCTGVVAGLDPDAHGGFQQDIALTWRSPWRMPLPPEMGFRGTELPAV
jgi:hypothetical protein